LCACEIDPASGAPLRGYLAEKTRLRAVVDFGDLQVFEGVTTYPAILVMENAAPQADHRLDMLNLTDTLPENLGQRFSQNHGSMPQSRLGVEGWQLEDETLAALRYKLTHAPDGQPYPCLKEVYGSPLYGIKTGYNQAFVIDQATRDALVAQDPASADMIKPFLEGKDLKKWHAQNRGLWLIALPKYWTREQLGRDRQDELSEEDAWAYLVGHHPGIAGHLLPFADKARKRGDKGEFWWELRSCAYYDKFNHEKLIYPDLSQGSKFQVASAGVFFPNTVYFYPNNDHFLLGLLNTKAIWFFLRGISDALRGGEWRLRLFTQNMDRIPVPDGNEEQRNTIRELAEKCQQAAEQRQRIAERFACRLCDDLCPEGHVPKLNTKSQRWWLLNFKTLQSELNKSFKLKAKDVLIPVAERDDWEDYFDAQQAKIVELDEALAATELKLNQAVNALFGLTSAEQALL
jgi:hypothetical protein